MHDRAWGTGTGKWEMLWKLVQMHEIQKSILFRIIILRSRQPSVAKTSRCLLLLVMGHECSTTSWPLQGRRHRVLAIAGTNAARPGHCRDECSTMSWSCQGRRHRVLAIAGTNAPRPGHGRDECSTVSWPLQGRMHRVLAIAGTNAPRPSHVRDECTASWPLQGRMQAVSWPLQGRMQQRAPWPCRGRRQHRGQAASGTNEAAKAGTCAWHIRRHGVFRARCEALSGKPNH